MEYYKKIQLKDGRECIIRSGTEEDGQGTLDNFILTHEETDNLLQYPDEIKYTVEDEAKLNKLLVSENAYTFVGGRLYTVESYLEKYYGGDGSAYAFEDCDMVVQYGCNSIMEHNDTTGAWLMEYAIQNDVVVGISFLNKSYYRTNVVQGGATSASKETEPAQGEASAKTDDNASETSGGAATTAADHPSDPDMTRKTAAVESETEEIGDAAQTTTAESMGSTGGSVEIEATSAQEEAVSSVSSADSDGEDPVQWGLLGRLHLHRSYRPAAQTGALRPVPGP